MTLSINNESFECSKAIKGNEFIILLDDAENCIAEFSGISDFSGYILTDGEYTAPLPTLEQRNRADIDYIGMMTGVL